jgi:hypothetical protein
MTRKHGKDARILIDQYDASGLANTWTLNYNVDTSECTAMLDTSKEYLVGDYASDMSFGSYFDTGSDNWDEVSWQHIVQTGGTRYAALCPYGYTAGDVVYELTGAYTNKTIPSPVGDAVTLDGSIQGTKTGRGIVLLNASITGTGEQTGQNYGATTAATTKIVVYRISGVSGPGNMVFALEESQDNGSGDAYAAIASFASGTLTANGVTVKSAAVATEAYLRVNATTFASTSATVRVTVVTLP